MLSLGLGRNYGGILQQFALVKYLEQKGIKVIVLNRKPTNGNVFKRVALFILRAIGIKRFKLDKVKDTSLQQFIDREFIFSKPLYTGRRLYNVCKKEHLNTIVYGSDQIWRRDNAIRYGFDYFGASTPLYVRKIAYAPSFGLDTWEYTDSETRQIKNLLESFYALSCREESGVELIKEKLGFNASLVCDPTMLLEESDYAKIASSRLTGSPYCFVYWLGDKASMESAIHIFKIRNQGLGIIALNLRDKKNEFPEVTEWLSLIRNASYVITDSFHGTVFSIIFKRQFEVYCNLSGGYSRIQTLLNQLGLQNKLIDMSVPVDYEKIDDTLHRFIQFSKGFLDNALSKR